MNLQMKDLLKSYNSLNNSLHETFKLIENKLRFTLKENHIQYRIADIFLTGKNPFDLVMEFHISNLYELSDDEINIIENEACCKLSYKREAYKFPATDTMEYIYFFKPLKIIDSPVENSWLKD